ncbi:hypothetical protein PPBDW_I21770 [Photobacterium kishitanii]|nr:hypothetical protein PPBDW_I21768 [Photobacterium kishitanii]CEO39753.1 hypothetical protein PPBDW_I21769 [Photobacterium kishitanii]CEO39754.1 hypothetical protein PPBDW_I21770 [Photobacterium kishitanii]
MVSIILYYEYQSLTVIISYREVQTPIGNRLLARYCCFYWYLIVR